MKQIDNRQKQNIQVRSSRFKTFAEGRKLEKDIKKVHVDHAHLKEGETVFRKPEENKELKAEQPAETIHVGPKVGRNDPCPCGSGKKYKKCCLLKKE